MHRLTYDVVIFGYGNLTQQLIDFFREKKLRIACVTDRGSYDNRRNSNVDFFKYSGLVGVKIDTTITIFSWRDSLHLSNDDPITKAWFNSDNLTSHRSFLLSSVSVYQDSKTAMNEFEQNLSLNVHINKKYILENNLSKIMEFKGSRHLNLRVTNVYGFNLTYGLVSEVISSIRRKSVLKLYGSLDIIRDYLLAEDLFKAVYSLVAWPAQIKVINISTGVGTSTKQLLQLFREQGYILEYELIDKSSAPLKNISIIDCALLGSIVTWSPASLDVGLTKILT